MIQCVLCDNQHLQYLTTIQEIRLEQCQGCGLVRQVDTKREEAIPSLLEQSVTEAYSARQYVDYLVQHNYVDNIVIIVANEHPVLAVAESQGLKFTHVANAVDVHELEINHFDAVLVLYELEKSENPIQFLNDIHKILKSEGLLLLLTLSLSSRSASMFRMRWIGWNPENKHYFDLHTMESALIKSNFHHIKHKGDLRPFSIAHVYQRAADLPFLLKFMIYVLYILTPKPLRQRSMLKLRTSANLISAFKGEISNVRKKLSIVMPVYNEIATVTQSIEAVLGVDLPGIDRELIIVESNSKDQSRDAVLAFQDHHEVRIILEDKPRGKGHAVRTGLEQIQGDMVLIQDADLEYDVNDYEALITPLLTYQTAFVLGERHQGIWKMREYTSNPLLAFVYNTGHYVFMTALNILYGQNLKDPFTMYKVFRRECLHGLTFSANRFDFDFELVIKLLRKGYKPIEIPVNYESRSFEEGKKVNTFRDPITWIIALIRYRFVPLYREVDT